jgi:hypothetical protein
MLNPSPVRRTARLSGRRRAGPLKPVVRPPDRSAAPKEFLYRQADIARDLSEQRGRNVSAAVERYGRAAAIRVSVLAMGPAPTGFDEAESFKQRRGLAGLENWQRARHYAT